MYRKTEAVVDLEAIRGNLALAAKLSPGARNVAVIKANGYGHGLVPVAKALRQDAPLLAVAILDELLQDEHPDVREIAAESIEQLNNPS